MQAHDRTSTDHPPSIEWVSDYNLYLRAYDGRHNQHNRKNNEENKSKLQSKMWDSSMKSGERQWQKWECARTDDKASHKAEDQVKLILESCGVSWYFIYCNYSVHTLPPITMDHLGLLSYLQIWPWLRCTGPPSHVWCLSPFHAEGLCVPHSGSCPPKHKHRVRRKFIRLHECTKYVDELYKKNLKGILNIHWAQFNMIYVGFHIEEISIILVHNNKQHKRNKKQVV